MKNMIQKATVVLGVALIAFTACKKDNVQNIASQSDETILVTQAGVAMDNVGVYSDENSGNIYMDNEGIAADFQVEANDCDLLQAAPGLAGRGDDSLRARIRNASFVKCLNDLNLSDGQKDSVKAALRGFVECKESAVKRAREIYNALQKEYKTKAEKLVALAKDGKITKEQLGKEMKALRFAFHRELRSKHLAEKLDDAMKNCLAKYFRQLHSILTERQWKAFVACHRK